MYGGSERLSNERHELLDVCPGIPARAKHLDPVGDGGFVIHQ
jgi:hypothetical protein